MTNEQKAAFVNAAVAGMQAEIAGMQAENAQRAALGAAPAHDAGAFYGLSERLGLTSEQVTCFFDDRFGE